MKKGIIQLLGGVSICLLMLTLVAATPLPATDTIQESELEQGDAEDSAQESESDENGEDDTDPEETDPPEAETPVATGGVSISFTLPRGWYRSSTARVRVSVTDRYDAGIQTVEAKSVQNGSWTDITDTLYLDISDNCTVYVQVTDYTGAVTAKSVYVECFDREKPTVRASRSGRLLRVEASDDLSGIDVIYVDGIEYYDHNDGALEVRINTRDNPDEKIWIQAKDMAGNLSSTYTMTNPYYEDDSADLTGQSTGNSTTDTVVEGSGTTTEAQTEAPATAAEAPATTTEATASTSEDSENRGGGVIAVGDKQFITIETRDEHIFYLIIDSSRDSDNVYLVTEATTRDLLSFTRDDAVEVDSSDAAVEDGGAGTSGGSTGAPATDADKDTLIDGGSLPGIDGLTDDGDGWLIIGDGNPPDAAGDGDAAAGEASPGGEQTGAEGQAEDDDKKPSAIPGWIVIGVLALIAAFAGYMFLVVLPRKKAKEAFIDDEEDDEEDDPEPYDGELVEEDEDMDAENALPVDDAEVVAEHTDVKPWEPEPDDDDLED